MTSSGSPYARLRRALATGNPRLAWAAAHELPRLSLEDALAVLLLQVGEDHYPRAAARWLARLLMEGRGATIAHAQLAAGALGAIPSAVALDALAALCEDLGMASAATAATAYGRARE